MSSEKKLKINANAPTESMKEALQTGLQGTISNIQQGLPPSNTQMENAIDTTTTFLEEKASGLPPPASKATGDIARVLEDTKEFLQQKNPDESLQKIFVESAKATEIASSEAAKGLEGTKNTALEYQGQAKEIFSAATSVVREIIRSREFRVLLLELIDTLSNAFWRTEKRLESATGGKAPSIKEALKQDISKPEVPGGELRETRKTAKELAKRVQYTMQDETAITPEERTKLRERLSKVLLRLKNNPQFNHATQGLLSLARGIYQEFVDSVNRVSEQSASQRSFRRITCESRKYLERFTSGITLDKFSESFNCFVNSVINDQQLKKLIDDWGWVFQESLKNPDLLVNSPMFIDKCEAIMKESRAYLKETMNNNTYLQDITDEGRNILNSVMEDPLSNRLASDTKIMVQNFFQVDASGRTTLNLELINQMKGLLVPLLIDNLRWVPLPFIEGSNDNYDYWFDHIVFCAPDLVPDQIHLRMVSEGDINVKELQTDNFGTFIHLSARGIKTTIKDVEFWFRHKTFPVTEDHGYATVELQGDGTSIDIVIGVTQGDNPFTVRKADIHLDAMKVSVADTRHDWLYNTLVLFFGGVIKERLQNQLQEGLRSLTSQANAQLNRILYKAYQETTVASQSDVAGVRVT